ncbi:acetate/CoA ligase [Chloroherpeton thalassium ATCC 35110]|uniref:Acetyl-coenzyme A synthetase n=1 Tax=Chloroherpeton thalassium (strain ATCC 35110 / GB-78) TaxID=517418 RepID=B3QTF4_CHLT3|nr:acetate--CoA ligase [Chloroherpeton thalassium]ACF12700.1 acetate/CoA ligase [Chloroherpeton thalassium ATCC 35110]
MPTNTESNAGISSVLHEQRVFKPGPEFSEGATIKSMDEYEKQYKIAADDPQKYWANVASQYHWFKKWDTVLEWNEPFSKWFVGGETNLCYNALDVHINTWRKNKAAIIWEGEPGDQRTLTYLQLHREVSKFANVLKRRGIQKGDRVAIYMGMTPELVIAVLACARIGAVHNVIFAGFSAHALTERINDSHAKMIVCADGTIRRGKSLNLKEVVDEALVDTPSIQNVIVYQRTKETIHMQDGRDHWWHDLMGLASEYCPAESLDSEHPLFILYTSGSTGKPKGILHSTGGYMTHVANSFKHVFDVKEQDIYWCTADIGWITGHSYMIYGPLINGSTIVVYEGAPNYPQWDRFWDIIQRHKVTIFYTAPTAIRAFIRAGDEWVTKHDLSSLRLLGTVGEPINPEAWMWYYKNVGKEKCPIVDTWWQTETGGIMISPLPGATPLKPGTATRPLPGILVDVVHKDGTPCQANEGGFLVVKHPWPSMLRTIYGDEERYKTTYWSEVDGMYFTGDGARKDNDGYIWIMGRVDDVVNISGHRLGTSEVESALVSHEAVAEAAVVSRPDEVKGNALVAFVTLKEEFEGNQKLREELRAHVAKEIGPIAKPDDVRWAAALPKTRSGKIMRRLLREMASSKEVKGDVTTLEDFTVLEKLREEEEESKKD